MFVTNTFESRVLELGIEQKEVKRKSYNTNANHNCDATANTKSKYVLFLTVGV